MLQVRLHYHNKSTGQHIWQVAWVDYDDLKPGQHIKLKKDDRWWEVRETYPLTIQHVTSIRTDWKVGGL